MTPAHQLIGEVASQLHDHSRLDARWLLGLAHGIDQPIQPHMTFCLLEAEYAYLEQLIDARKSGQPISRMRGKREFWSLDFYLNQATLDPRPDSETLVMAACDMATSLPANKRLRVLDLGTGSGCLLLSVLKAVPHATGKGIDLSPLALAQARANAAYLHLAERASFMQGHWGEGCDEQFDIILCNPPYIRRDDQTLSPDVRDYDPPLALFAGDDGLECYRVILPQLPRLLRRYGRAFIELGAGEDEAVSMIAQSAGLHIYGLHPDLAGIGRCLILGLK